MDTKTPLIYLFAGEPSGDDRGQELARALKALCPGIRLIGVPGPKMRNEGVECIVPMEQFQVMGFIDVFVALPRIIRLFKQVKRSILTTNPDAVVTIDYPGFNLRLAKALAKAKHKAKRIHFVCPSVWAWGKKRIPLMAEIFDHLITILPFEKKYFANTKLPLSYAGHPLTHTTNQRSPDNLLAIFPGSRTKEIKRNLPLQLRVANTTGLPIAISCAAPNKLALIRSLAPDTPITCEPLMPKASFAIATSGTICLELALAKIPTVVTYAITAFDTFLATKVFKINMPYYALPNIIANKEVFPEHFGPSCTFTKIKESFERLQKAPEKTIALCENVFEILGPPPTDHTLASPILDLVKKQRRAYIE